MQYFRRSFMLGLQDHINGQGDTRGRRELISHDAILKLSKVLYLKDSLPLEPGQYLST